MSEFHLSPFDLRVLIHYLGTSEPFPSRASPSLVEDSIAHLCRAGLIASKDCPAVTEMGRAWIDKACTTPLPVQKWVWE